MLHLSIPSRLLDVGVASTALTGHRESGDLHLVRPVDGGDSVLVAVVDGLGHGQEAAVAARIAIDTLDRHAAATVPHLIQHCHEALIGTRGVVMSVAQFDAARDPMTWVGVGNVAGVLAAGDREGRTSFTALVTRAGIVGSPSDDLPARPWVIPIQPHDILVLATDGLRADFVDDIVASQDPQTTAM